MNRLSAENVRTLAGVKTPAFDPKSVGAGILHIGMGNFHRAHQAVYTDDILHMDPRWGFLGANLFSAGTRERLNPQDCLYTVCERDASGSSYRVIGAVKDVFCLGDQREQLMNAFCSPDIKVVSLTVTEKGYCHTAAGELDEHHPDIRHDISRPDLARSMPGVVVAGLRARKSADAGPLTVVSCDNLSGNGRTLQQVLRNYVDLVDPEFVSWFDSNLSFPETMVDRIVPQPTKEDRSEFSKYAGTEDEGLIVCEPFRQWVIENNFVSERPPWEEAGAGFVSDVTHYEMIKLRMLNAAHSAIAYLGLLFGYDYIHEAMSDDSLAEFVDHLLSCEVIPLIDAPPGMDLQTYKKSIFDRFANSEIAYGTAQVAADGSMKLPQRVYPSLEVALANGSATAGLSMVVAAWMQCMQDPELSKKFSDPASGSNELLTVTGANPEVARVVDRSFEETSGRAIREMVEAITAGR